MPGRRINRGGGRRQFLLKLGGTAAIVAGAGTGLASTGAFDAVTSSRPSDIDVASAGAGILGIENQGPVKKNSRDPMVRIANNGGQTVTVTVTLDDCSQGTLFDNNGDSGCSVTFTLASGNAQFVDVEASVSGTISYSVSTTGTGLSLDTVGSVLAETGNVKGAVRIQQPSKDQDFTASLQANLFLAHKVDVRDGDGDDDLASVAFTVREGNAAGTVVGSFVESNPPGDRYAPNGNPAVRFTPNAGYTIRAGRRYVLTVRAEDADGNFATETVEDTPS